jgi:hypothetical protein
MLNKSERYARMSIDGWVVVLLVASDCLKQVRKRVEAIERMRQDCENVCELCRPRHHHLKTHTVVGWRTWVGARLRAEGASVIVRVRMVGTAYRSKWMR